MAPGLNPLLLLHCHVQSTTRLLLTVGRSSKKPWKKRGCRGELSKAGAGWGDRWWGQAAAPCHSVIVGSYSQRAGPRRHSNPSLTQG